MAGFRQILLPWDSQPQDATGFDQSALSSLGIVGGFITGGGQPGTPYNITGQPVVYGAGTGNVVRLDPVVTPYGIGGSHYDDGSTNRYMRYRLGAVNSRNFTFLARVRAASATGIIARSSDTGTGTTIPLWRNSGAFDMRVNGTDFTAAGTWSNDVWYDIEIVGSASSCVLWVNGAVVINGGAAAAGTLDANFVIGDVSGGGVATGGYQVVYALWADRALSASERAEFRARPWQLFEPQRLFVPVAAASASLDIDATSLSLSGALTASGDLQRDLNLSASPVGLAGTLAPSGDLAFYVPMLDVSAGTVALSGAITAAGDVEIGTSFDVAADPVALAGSVTASGDIQIAEEELLDVAASPVSISGAVSVAGDLAYLVPTLDIEAGALALSGSVGASGDIAPELHVDLGSGTVALSGSVDIAGDLGLGTSFDLSADPIVVSGAVAVSGDPAAEVIDVSAAAVWSYVLANGKTAAQTLIENNEMLRIVMAAVAGTSTGVGTDTETYFGVDGTTPRVIATFDAQGNRSSVTVDGSP